MRRIHTRRHRRTSALLPHARRTALDEISHGELTMTKGAVVNAKCENLSAGMEDLLLGSRTGPTFDESYTVGKKLQGGSYGTVYLGKHNLSERECAIKVVDRT